MTTSDSLIRKTRIFAISILIGVLTTGCFYIIRQIDGLGDLTWADAGFLCSLTAYFGMKKV